MGRKPNAIVQEYFHRGQKLNDASNRYVHTCKRCGVVFPKGRVDSLMSHLLRRCPSVTQEDRHLIYDAVQHQNPDLRRPPRHAEVKSHHQHQQPLQHPLQHQIQPQIQHQHHPQSSAFDLQQTDVSLPLLLQREQSALDTLAEVSRRHLDYSTHRPSNDDASEPTAVPDAGRTLAEQALLAQLQGNAAIAFLPSSAPGSAASRAPVPPELSDVPHPTQHHVVVDPTPTSSTISSSPLIQTASAANRQLEQAARAGSHDMLDPQLEAQMTAHLDPAVAAAAVAGQYDPEDISWASSGASAAESLSALIANMPSVEQQHPPNQQPPVAASKHRRRGQFSDTRRKQVQEIRKRGACIRCRMLKKPCSEGTPCSTCKNVESARLWKSACLRTRLADEFTLWSAGLYHSKAKIEVPASVHGLRQQPLPGRIEVKIFPQSDLCMTFAIRKYTKEALSLPTGDAGVDALEQGSGNTRHGSKDGLEDPDADVFLLDEGEGMSSKVEEYANAVMDASVTAEPSPFLRSTIEHARALVHQEELEGDDPSTSNAQRSCYNFQSQQLLKNVIELWAETTILASPKWIDLTLVYNPTKEPAQIPDVVQPPTESTATSEGVFFSSQSATLIRAQLLAATESRCFALGKSVMNEIERRLLQRQQVSRYSTFISAIVLLNCIERMTGTFRAFDPATSASIVALKATGPESTPDPTSDLSHTHPLPYHWPLQDPPRKLWSQGEHFADLLIMLLRLRALPPKTTTTYDGYLVVNGELPAPMPANARSAKEPGDDQLSLPASWLDPLQLSVDELVAKRDGPFPEHDQDVADWNLKFISQVLLPEGIRSDRKE